MPTKYSRYCDGIMEAGWIAALILVPLFFNVYSSRIFEPDKLTLLRSISLVVMAAWLLKLVFEGGPRWENLPKDVSAAKSFLRTPLVIPVLLLAGTYLISTIFSIHPWVSLFGSYQRLQGTYTAFSYLVIFGAIAANMRYRPQIDRLVSALIITSLPISLYGILQRYQIDPVPWAGDTTSRVASNMGNAIFVAAYLIMANPFTLIRIVESFRAILSVQKGVGIQVARATVYVFIAALQVIALYLSQSRGPWLGWLAGLFFAFILLTLQYQKRKLLLSVIGIGLVLGVFLLLLNIPNGPLQSLRNHPYLGRIGHLAEASSDTGRVRVLIWEGSAELYAPHEPLEFPDGRKDTFNFLRPLIGYGPETMYVAFNRFYPPELGTLEKRNASPDRSHNETWDSLVTMGLLGLVTYLLLFGSVFYYGLKWLGLIANPRQRSLFLGFFLVGGAVGGIGFSIWRGIGYLGIGLPFGVIIGMIAYLTLDALIGVTDEVDSSRGSELPLYIIAPLAAIVAHFVETNFGIAIAATRTLFWSSAGLMFVAGYVMPRITQGEPAAIQEPQSVSRRKTSRRKTRSSEGISILDNQSSWVRIGLVAVLILGIILATLGYEFISNSRNESAVMTILVKSLTQLANRGGAYSPGVLALVLTTWLAGAIILIQGSAVEEIPNWLRAFGLALVGSLVLGLLVWLIQASNLAHIARSQPTTLEQLLEQLQRMANLLTWYYVIVFLLLFVLALFLPERWPSDTSSQTIWQPVAALIAFVITFLIASNTNLRNIQANIIFKMGEPLSGDQYPIASVIFDQAHQMQPKEDFYNLYLGRSYLEQAKSVQDPAQLDDLMGRADQVLQDARRVNPLNTDHSANLARMYSWWAGNTTDPTLSQQRAEAALNYYEQALSLSPNNPPLWTEKASLLMTLGRVDEGVEALQHAIDLDPSYTNADLMLADYYQRLSQTLSDPEQITETLYLAANYFGLAAESKTSAESRIKYYFQQGSILTQIQDYETARDAYLNALALEPADDVRWQIDEALAGVYWRLGQVDAALASARQALENATGDAVARIQQLIDFFESAP